MSEERTVPPVDQDDEDEREEAGREIIPVEDQLPSHLHIFTVDQPLFFPGMSIPIHARDGERQTVLQQAIAANRKYFGFLARIDLQEAPLAENHHRVGVVARIVRSGRTPDGVIRAFVMVEKRFEVVEWQRTAAPLVARVSYPDETHGDAMRTKALFERTRHALMEYIKLIPGYPAELNLPMLGIREGARLADFVAANINLKTEERQRLLETFDVTERLEQALIHLMGELEIRKLGQHIQQQIQENLEKRQKEFYLREQMKAIRKELGEEKDEKSMAEEKYAAKIEAARMPPEAEERAKKELQRLSQLSPESAEFNVIRTFLDVMLDLPWSVRTEDRVDIRRVKKVLDEDHFGLERVKERIVEYLAVRQLKGDGVSRGPILCLNGPPGVGKTSLAKSVGRALDKKLYRFSLGGMRDEAEIKGHRRTYIGAMPGKILQGMTRAGTKNPVFVLDEIDKLGKDWRGDPSSAMLEVLDPEQNSAFLDHYLDVPYDLSEVFFICTSNVKENIPDALRDRMEIIDIPGYVDEEKAHIAERHLLPKQIADNGLLPGDLTLDRAAILEIVHDYTAEAGVRNLERQMARLCRKVAALKAGGRTGTVAIRRHSLAKYLGPKRFKDDLNKRVERPGMALGLAWTPFGGDVLLIESQRMPGNGQINLTGQLGNVMTESARLSLSYLKANAQKLSLPQPDLRETDLHVHFPAGAIPKDGPSAGITITTALASLFSGRKVKPGLAMTGEITLTGRVLPVGGIREKVLGAYRHGIHELIIPKANLQDLEEVPANVRKKMTFHGVETFEEVAVLALPPDPQL